MLRRLPIYVLLDCSESMAGQRLQDVEVGLYSMISSLSRNPYAIETAFLSFITFAAKAKVITPLTEVTAVPPPSLSCRPGTSLGAALDLLRESIGREVVQTTKERKGDFKPQVFIITDGYPTDDWRKPLERLRAVRPHLATIYAIGCGDEADFETLSQIADECIHVKTLTTESLSKLFLWLSASVQSQSVSPEGGVSLDKVPLEKGMELVDKARPPRFSGRDQRLYFHVTCRKTRELYMMIFKRSPGGMGYAAQENLKLPKDFFGDGTMKAPPIDSSLLEGGVDCPYCGAIGWGKCGFCGHLFCLDDEAIGGEIVCPVCESRLAASESDDSFSVDGSQG